MKVHLKLVSVTLLVSITGLAGCLNQSPSHSNNQPRAGVTTENASIPVLLPDVVEVRLNKGQSKSGRLSAFDSKKIVITPGGGSPVSIPIDQIKDKTVAFKGQVRYRSNGKLVIRGQDNTKSVPDTWQGIPLSDFQRQDVDTAQVKITSLDKTKQKGIQQVAANSHFKVDEMQLEPASGKMTLKVTTLDQ